MFGFVLVKKKTLDELTQRLQNLEAEVFFPKAQVMMQDKTLRMRVTLNGCVNALMERAQRHDPRINELLKSQLKLVKE
jgi:hypothetical protein